MHPLLERLPRDGYRPTWMVAPARFRAGRGPGASACLWQQIQSNERPLPPEPRCPRYTRGLTESSSQSCEQAHSLLPPDGWGSGFRDKGTWLRSHCGLTSQPGWEPAAWFQSLYFTPSVSQSLGDGTACVDVMMICSQQYLPFDFSFSWV